MAEKTYFEHDNTNVFKRQPFGRHSDTNLTKANASVPKKTPVEHSIGEETKPPYTFYILEESYSACAVVGDFQHEAVHLPLKYKAQVPSFCTSRVSEGEDGSIRQPGECNSKTSSSSSGSEGDRESEGEQDFGSQENEGGAEPEDCISGKQPEECNSKTSNSSSGSEGDRESEGGQDFGSEENERGAQPEDGISGKQPEECNSKTSNNSSGSKGDRKPEGKQDFGSEKSEGGSEPKDGVSGKQPGECNSKTMNSSSVSKGDRESEGEQDFGSEESEGGSEPKDGVSGKQPGECNSKTMNSSSVSKGDRESEGEQDFGSEESEGVAEPKDGISGKQPEECHSKTSNSSLGRKSDRESEGEQDFGSEGSEGGSEPKDGISGKQPGERNSNTSNSSPESKSDRGSQREQDFGSKENESGFDDDGSSSGDAGGCGGGDDNDDDDDDEDDDEDEDDDDCLKVHTSLEKDEDNGERQKKVKLYFGPSEMEHPGVKEYVHQDLSFQPKVLLLLESIQLLNMSKLPLSDGKNLHHALTLRLREGGKEVTVFTGLDDQVYDLISCIPDVALSYMDCDIDKTEEPSNLKGQSSFFPEVIINALQNVFTFMKSHSIMEGHTYWLVKGDKGVIMLYDLTSIRLQTKDVWKDECTRITVLMAVLFYRASKNMLKTLNRSPFMLTKHGTIDKLLDNCLARTLDGDDRLPEIFAAASYLLSDDYTIAIDKVEKDDYEAQLKMALSCIVKGLACVKKRLVPDVQSSGGACWQNMIAGLLFHKAGAVYYSLARMCSSEGRFGGGLKNCELAFKCIKASSSLTAEGVIGEDGQLLVKTQYFCGDFYLMLAKRQETLTRHEEEYIVISDDDRFLSDAAEDGILSKEEQSWSVIFVRGFRENMEQSVFSYLAAINSCSSSTETTFWVDIKRRLGNVQNELGVHDMDKAAALVANNAEPSAQEKKLLQRSSSNFESGISTFDLINDSANKSLVLSNLGRLKLIFAQAVRRRKRQEFSEEERGYFNQAFECYERAKLCIVERKESPHLWDKVTWELSESYFTMAKLMEDFTPLSSDSYKQVKSEIIELMEKALLLYVELRSVTPRQTAQFSLELDRRISSVHLQLASLYWSSYRNQAADQDKELSEDHFNQTFASVGKVVKYSQYTQAWPDEHH